MATLQRIGRSLALKRALRGQPGLLDCRLAARVVASDDHNYHQGDAFVSLNIRPLARAVSRGRPARHPIRSVRLKSRLRASLTTVLALMTVIASLISPALVTVTNAASGSDYLDQATDPHGGVWLRGTTNGLTNGPMDPGTNPASASFGHVWTTDVPSEIGRA